MALLPGLFRQACMQPEPEYEISMRKSLALTIASLLLLMVAAALHAEKSVLRVVAADGAEHLISAQSWAALPRTRVQAIDHDGKQVTFEGVAARELLKLANAPLEKNLRGKNLM